MEPISWPEHCRWFGEKRADPACRIYVVLDDTGEPIGQVRFDGLPARAAEVAVTIEPRRRSRGLGSLALRAACRRLREDGGPGEVVAHVKPDNRASLRAFEKAGFAREGVVTIEGQTAVRLRFGGHEEPTL